MTQTPTSSNTPEIPAITQAQSLITQAQSTLDGGHLVDMSPIDVQVRKACDAISKLSDEDAVQQQESMLNLERSLNDLHNSLIEKRDDVKMAINQTDTHVQGQSAYLKASSHAPKDTSNS